MAIAEWLPPWAAAAVEPARVNAKAAASVCLVVRNMRTSPG
jgi:hypothetical protein